jgi:hypothetical protein
VLVEDRQFVQKTYSNAVESKDSTDSVILIFPKELILSVFAPGFSDIVFDHANTLSKDMCEDRDELCAKPSKDHNSLEVDVPSLLKRYVDVCDHLAVLSLTKCNIRWLDFQLLPKTLKKLCLGLNRLENLDQCNFSTLKHTCPNIAELFLHGNNLYEVPKDSLKTLGHLKELGLDSNNLREFDITDLPDSLTKLWLSNNLISELDFNSLSESCPLLELFDLSFNSVL